MLLFFLCNLVNISKWTCFLLSPPDTLPSPQIKQKNKIRGSSQFVFNLFIDLVNAPLFGKKQNNRVNAPLVAFSVIFMPHLSMSNQIEIKIFYSTFNVVFYTASNIIYHVSDFFFFFFILKFNYFIRSGEENVW